MAFPIAELGAIAVALQRGWATLRDSRRCSILLAARDADFARLQVLSPTKPSDMTVTVANLTCEQKQLLYIWGARPAGSVTQVHHISHIRSRFNGLNRNAVVRDCAMHTSLQVLIAQAPHTSQPNFPRTLATGVPRV